MQLLKIVVFTIIGLGFSGLTSFSQTAPNKIFGAPLEVPMYLAGNFGEIRGNHFHAGIDMKTNQVEGLRVISVADGYVSRIKISS